MNKQHLFEGHTLALLLLIMASYCTSARHYQIVPYDSASQCQGYAAGTCFTLMELVLFGIQQDKDLTLNFHPGEHSLTERVTIKDHVSVTLTGEKSLNEHATIKCVGVSGFDIIYVNSLNVEFLEFDGCGNVVEGGAIAFNNVNNITIKGCNFINNYVIGDHGQGGAIYAENTAFVKIQDSVFDSNSAARHSPESVGGAISVFSVDGGITQFTSVRNRYVSNTAAFKGGAVYCSGKMFSMSDYYVNNMVEFDGGAIFIDFGNIVTRDNFYKSNSALFGEGGAIYIVSGNKSSMNDYYISNSACYNGGAVSVQFGNDVTSTNDSYINNQANLGTGGAISHTNSLTCTYLKCSNSKIVEATFIQNSAVNGGAIFKTGGLIEIGQTKITGNFASNTGVVYMNSVSLTFSEGVSFTNNQGSLYIFNSQVEFKGTAIFENNRGDTGGAISATLSQILTPLTATVTIHNNTATTGGGISLTQSSLRVYHSIEVTQNIATGLGGGIYAYQSQIDFNPEQTQTSEINRNTASNGGAIFAVAVNIKISNTYVNFDLNTAKFNGGAIFLEQNSKVYIQKNVPEDYRHPKKVKLNFTSNSAGVKGGAIFVDDNSNAGILCDANVTNTNTHTAECFIQTLGLFNYVDENGNFINIFFSNNTALQSGSVIYGGLLDRCTINPNAELLIHSPKYMIYTGLQYIKAVAQIEHVADYKPRPNLTEYLIATITRADVHGLISSDVVQVEFCLDDVISPNYNYPTILTKKGDTFTVSLVAVDQVGNPLNASVITLFYSKSGKGHIKDDQANRKVGSQCTELKYNVYSINNSAQLQIHADGPCGDIGLSERTLNLMFSPCTCSIGFQPTPSENECICTCDSKLNTLLFCEDDEKLLNYNHTSVFKKKGEFFSVSVIAISQVGNPLNATIVTSFSSKSGKGHLKDSQVVQRLGNECTKLEYNVYSLDESAQLHLTWYSDTPCGPTVLRKILDIYFLPCSCPVGFQSLSSENDCICECDKQLKQYQITNCFVQNETILVETNTWIGFNYTNGTGFLIHKCPFDYCVQEPVYIDLRNLENADKKCAYNRTGILCGMCRDKLSLVLGSSRCQECSNYYLFLLIPFALAGIAIVAFILLLNMTVATGTVHGLIYYANILAADYPLFLRFETPNILTVFISWLNLDLGIETCFYNGMDSYGKFLLQLAFPAYVFVLIGAIIMLCEVSEKFARLLGNRNPVAALCTLILLSYSKLIRTIITALQFTYLDYPDGSRDITWLYDANVPYYTVNHTPRFIAAFVIIILGTVYTTLLFFGQWFSRLSNHRCMKWTRNTKYNAFIDAYHAPFTPRHRYWMGLLVFVIMFHNLLSAMTADSPVPILSAGCLAIGLIMFKLLNTKVYKNKLQDSLETIFLVNIAVLAIATYHVRETNENQLALANTSMAITFILFLVILCYHTYKYVLIGTRVWSKVTKWFNKGQSRNQRYPLAPVENESPIINNCDTDTQSLDSNNQLREPDLDILDPICTDDYNEPLFPPVDHQPPKITYTVIQQGPGADFDRVV